jgi:hypothetical protein
VGLESPLGARRAITHAGGGSQPEKRHGVTAEVHMIICRRKNPVRRIFVPRMGGKASETPWLRSSTVPSWSPHTLVRDDRYSSRRSSPLSLLFPNRLEHAAYREECDILYFCMHTNTNIQKIINVHVYVLDGIATAIREIGSSGSRSSPGL